ncbi:predicted protein [Uncinocarpus reesii 1704]|uniref:Cytochrome P450 n=1 Tax=Uncinocarpus reesii (strain UAMH 1704) TaxID=336963 RepID=C4JPZ5_UNCRE|nr:uncharacterized protein UREG_03228 [Uncinocarpus reesii 1704]EEP78382.1 predicted protein [Uncinocarpus reesii 1704]
MENAFGARRSTRAFNRASFHADSGPIQFLSKDPWLTDVSSSLVREVQKAMPNLLSFSPSVVDQSTWERLSDVYYKQEDGGPVCEVGLFSLVRNFVGMISTTVIMGTAFTETFPYALNELWAFDSRFNAVLLGIPRWVPFPGLVTAYAARRRLLLALKSFHNGLAASETGVDAGFDWRDMDDVSEVIKARSRALTDAGYTAEQAACEHLAFFWAMNMTTNTMIFWNLVHILLDKQLKQEIMEEIKPHSKVTRSDWGESGFSIPEPPRLHIDAAALVSACPLLKATYYESIRVYATPLSYRQLINDITLSEPTATTTVATSRPNTYKCDAGSYVAVPHFMHNMDPKSFPDPEDFRPWRFLPEKSEETSDVSDEDLSLEDEKLIADDESISQKMRDVWPREGSTILSYSPEFAERQALIFTAAFLTMWDIEQADGKAWKVPRPTDGSATCVPRKDIKVRMKLRV